MNGQIKNKSKILAGLILLFYQVLQINASPSNIPLSNLLDASGKLQNCRNLTGSVDFSGYVPIIDDCKGLTFLPMPVVAPGWNALGSGLNSTVLAIAVSGSDVYVGGIFTNAGGNANADHIARWDGSNWNALGTGLNDLVRTIAVSGSDVYVGGIFFNAGGNANADNIARWDGSNWNALGAGASDVYFIAVSDSDVYVGGDFTNAGGNANADNIARWDGSAWSALGTGLNGPVLSISVTNSNIYVGGDFTDAGGNANADKIARWDGSAWNALGTGLNDIVITIAVSGSDVYVGGRFTYAGGIANADNIARWDGSGWNALGTGPNGTVWAIVVSGSDVYVGGNFINAGGNANANYIARWNGATWNALGTGLDNSLWAIAVSGSDVYVGGNFINAGGNTNADRIARWDNTPLPVEVLSFDAKQHEESVWLDWHIATQVDNEGWDIEHSIDGSFWERIGWVQGDGNSSISKQFYFVHQYPKTGHNYYRIRQNDFEGNYAYSRMVLVNFENQASVKIYPTLTTGIIHFESNPEDIEAVKIFDACSGFSCDTHQISHIDISDKPPGMYVVQILKDGKWTLARVFKQ